MRAKWRAIRESRLGPCLIEAINWSPAAVFFGLYVANQDLLFLSYAVAFAMWQQVRVLRRL